MILDAIQQVAGKILRAMVSDTPLYFTFANLSDARGHHSYLDALK
jgi:hypothetical protein